MYRSLLMLGAFLFSFAQNAFSQCTVDITPAWSSVCVGQTFTLSATPGATTYQWYQQGQPIIGANNETYIGTGVVPGTTQFTVEATFGVCSVMSSVANVTVNQSLQATATANNPICGGTLMLSVTGTFGIGSTFAWWGPNGWNSTQQNPVIPNATPSNTGIYTVTVTFNGCVVTAQVTVTVGSINQVTATNNSPACIGDVVELSATTITGATYSWTGPNGYTSNLQNPSFTVNGQTEGGIYTVASNENGCISTDTTLVLLCNTVLVRNYLDINSNCIYETGFDSLIAFPVVTNIDSNGVTVAVITSTGWFYYTPNGNNGDVYTFSAQSLPGGMISSCPVTGVVEHTITSAGFTHIDMGVECNTLAGFDLGVSASNPTTGAISQTGYIYLSNSFCSSMNATVTLTHSPKYQFNSSSITPSGISGNTITWNLGNLSNGNYPTGIYYHLSYTTAPLIAGDTTHSLFTISPVNNDVNPLNNTFVKIDTVIASYDPNAITAFPAECVTAGTNMQYMIQFENIGNAPAENIYILDTLPAELEVSTMELVMSSHNMYVTKIQDGGYNILRFDFPNINLPDSSNHAECHGMLVYTIDLNSALPYGAEVFHKAGIYFDYNDVVMTNNERTSICVPQNVSTTTKGSSTILYPNPAGDELTVQTDGTFNNATITNSIGQVMMEQLLDKKQQRVNISSLAPGMYYVNISGPQGSEVLKFVKM